MQIRRDIEALFLAWKQSENRKPILLQGARQIGKTWAMEKFGKDHFPSIKTLLRIPKSQSGC